MGQIKVSKKFNSLKIGDTVEEGGNKYKVVTIKTWVNHTGGTDYILEETFASRLFNFFKKNK